MGFIGRLSCNQHNNKGVQTIFQINLGSNTTTSFDSNFFHKKQLGTSNNSFRLIEKGVIGEIIISTRLHFSRIFIQPISGELKLRRTMIFVCGRTSLWERSQERYISEFQLRLARYLAFQTPCCLQHLGCSQGS